MATRMQTYLFQRRLGGAEPARVVKELPVGLTPQELWEEALLAFPGDYIRSLICSKCGVRAGIARDDTTSRIAYDPAFLEVDVLVFDTPKGYEDKLNALQAQLEALGYTGDDDDDAALTEEVREEAQGIIRQGESLADQMRRLEKEEAPMQDELRADLAQRGALRAGGGGGGRAAALRRRYRR